MIPIVGPILVPLLIGAGSYLAKKGIEKIAEALPGEVAKKTPKIANGKDPSGLCEELIRKNLGV